MSHDWLEKDGLVIDATADQFTTYDEFIGENLPFVHDGNTPLNRVFRFSEKRDVVKEGVHTSAEGAHQQIRAALNL